MRLFPLVFLFLLAAATAHAGSSVKALTKQFSRLDSNKDTSLSTDELGKLLPAKFTRNGALVETQEMMFAWFDEDASEGIDLGEWIAGKTSDGADSPDFYGNVFDELDANGKKGLEWKEFSRVISKYVSSKTARAWFDAISSGSSTGSSVNSGISATSSNYTLSGATLTLGGYFSEWTPFASTLTLVGWDSVSTVTNISGSIATAPDSNGTLTLSSANTYTGSTTVSSGTLNPESSSGTLTLADGLVLTASVISFDTVDAIGSSLQTVDFGGVTGTYNLFDLSLDTAASSIDQGGTAGSE
jgi:autotransporter-associated beta strand protein